MIYCFVSHQSLLSLNAVHVKALEVTKIDFDIVRVMSVIYLLYFWCLDNYYTISVMDT